MSYSEGSQDSLTLGEVIAIVEDHGAVFCAIVFVASGENHVGLVCGN